MTVDLHGLPYTFTYGEALAAGLTKHRLYALRDSGVIEAIARGLYRRVDSSEAVDVDLIEIARRAHRATLCLTSALVQHELADANPATIDVALPAGSRRPRVGSPVTWHSFDRRTFDIGRTTMPIDQRTQIGIYTAERCIIDAFRLRHREGDDLAYVALRRWLRHRESSPAALYEMAQHFPKTTKVITAALEIYQYE